jgi:hypothetical protein
LPALYWATVKVGGPESKSVTTRKPISSQLQHGKLIQDALIRLDCLVLHAKLSSRLGAHMSGRTGLLTSRRVFGSAGPTLSGKAVSRVSHSFPNPRAASTTTASPRASTPPPVGLPLSVGLVFPVGWWRSPPSRIEHAGR